jgi:hypothetical protein
LYPQFIAAKGLSDPPAPRTIAEARFPLSRFAESKADLQRHCVTSARAAWGIARHYFNAEAADFCTSKPSQLKTPLPQALSVPASSARL